MSNCHLVAGRSLIDLAASRLALRTPALRAATALTRPNRSAQRLPCGRHRGPTTKTVGPTVRLPGAAEKNTQPRGIISAPSCELKTCTPVHRSAWLLSHFSGQIVRRDSLLVVGITPTGNRDAGK